MPSSSTCPTSAPCGWTATAASIGSSTSLTNDLNKIAPGRAQYTHLLDEADASVLDDLIVWWHPERDGAGATFDVMPNASNTDRVVAAVGGVETTHRPRRPRRAGPAGRRAARRRVPRSRWHRAVPASRTPTGTASSAPSPGPATPASAGLEISVPADVAAELWAAIVAAGIKPAGLGARDTLRLEAALPLHGHELGPGITPLQAGLGWVVAWNKGHFRGRDALAAERDRGVARQLVGIATEGRRPPRAECPVLVDGDDGR